VHRLVLEWYLSAINLTYKDFLQQEGNLANEYIKGTAQQCPEGTAIPTNYHPDMTTVMKQGVCVRLDVEAAKEPVRQQLKAAMGALGLQFGRDYYSYIRVVPKSVVDNPPNNCSCMCGCS
jgi:hypothetical protein